MTGLWATADAVTVRRIQRIVREIESLKDDPETAHALEDGLYKAVVRGIASGNIGDSPRELATAALASASIVFDRWMA